MISQMMCSDEPNLFQRAILQSGTPNALVPLSIEMHETRYKRMFELLALPYDGTSAEERIQSLLTVPVDDIVKALSSKERSPGLATFHPLQDPSFFPVPVSDDTQGDIMSKCSWVDEIIIGDTFYEVRRLLPHPLSAYNNDDYR